VSAPVQMIGASGEGLPRKAGRSIADFEEGGVAHCNFVALVFAASPHAQASCCSTVLQPWPRTRDNLTISRGPCRPSQPGRASLCVLHPKFFCLRKDGSPRG